MTTSFGPMYKMSVAALIVSSIIVGTNSAPAFVTPTGMLASKKSFACSASSSSTVPDAVVRGTGENHSRNNDSIENTMSKSDSDKVRAMLKAAILEQSEGFTEYASKTGSTKGAVESEGKKKELSTNRGSQRRSRRFIGRIFSRFSKKDNEKQVESGDRLTGLLAADAPVPGMVNLGHEGLEVVRLAERLAAYNPTEVPTYGWQGYRDGSPKESPLYGTWKLIFTTAKDATFRDDPVRGKVTTYQDVDADKGTLTNVIDFEKGKLEGFRVVVAGEAKSNDEIDLTFKRVVVKRKSRFPRLFGRISIPLPSFKFLQALTRFASRGREVASRAYFNVKYVDENFRMHKTGDGNWFIQTRID